MNRIDSTKSVVEKIAELGALVDSEAEAARLRTIGEAWKFMKKKLDLVFQYDAA